MKDLYVQERRQLIIKVLEENSRASVGELADRFKVSEATIRTDLRVLEEKKVLQRTRGGAIVSKEMDLSFSNRSTQHIQEKKVIALEASNYIKAHDSVLMDASSTCVELAKILRKSDEALTVVTSGLHAAQILVENPKINTILIGGLLRNQNNIEGTLGMDVLNRVNAEKFFFSSRAVSPQGELMDFDLQETELKKLMFNKSTQHYCLLDSSKLRKFYVATFGSLKQTDVLICDDEAALAYGSQFKQMQIAIAKPGKRN